MTKIEALEARVAEIEYQVWRMQQRAMASAGLAQSAERPVCGGEVAGSIPAAGSTGAEMDHKTDADGYRQAPILGGHDYVPVPRAEYERLKAAEGGQTMTDIEELRARIVELERLVADPRARQQVVVYVQQPQPFTITYPYTPPTWISWRTQ